MSVLITGGAGFIGSHLARSLVKSGHKVTILDDFSNVDLKNVWDLITERKVKLIKGDIRDPKILGEVTQNIDVIFHLAAQIHIDKSILEPKMTFDVNAIGTLNILELGLKRDFEKIIYASTSEVYGTALTEKIDENHPLNPQSPYAASKVAADRLCHAYVQTYGMNVTTVRNFNVFGPFQKDTGYGSVIPIFIKRALVDKPPIIYGEGNQTRDFMFIDDAVKAYTLVMDSKNVNGEVFNFGSGREISITDLARLIVNQCGKKLAPVHVERRPGEVMRLCADTSKSQRVLGFKSQFTLEEGIRTYIEWFQKYKFDEWKMG